MVVLVYGSTGGDAVLGSGGEGEEVYSEVVVCAKKLEGVFVGDAYLGEGVVEDGGNGCSCCDYYSEDVVDVGNVVWGLYSDFFCRDKVHDVVAGGVSGKFRGEWSGSWHGASPAFAKGDKDEVSKVAEGVGVFVFFRAEDGARANAINHELDALMHGVNGRDGESDEFGDGREICDCVDGLVGVFEEVSDPCVEEGKFL